MIGWLFDKHYRGHMHRDRAHVRALIARFFPSQLFEWRLSDFVPLQGLLVSRVGEKYDSELFAVGGLRWLLEFDANGSAQVFACVAQLSCEMALVSTSTCLSCAATRATRACEIPKKAQQNIALFSDCAR